MPGTQESVPEGLGTTSGPDPRLRRLVVISPGLESSFWWSGPLKESLSISNWEPLKKRLEREAGFGPVKWLDFEHGSTPWSLSTIDDLAKKLRYRIDETWTENRGFDDILLVGHSMGGLIVRQAYLLAAGAVPNKPVSPWSERVSRILLFGSLNRGVGPGKIRLWGLIPLWGIYAWLVRAFPFLPSSLGLDALRGSCFVTNLRITWIHHFMEAR